MGLFHRNENEANFAGGSKNVMESIQRQNDTGTLIYLDDRQDFNTNSVITVAPNEQAIFIKNGEFYGTLPSGRHEVKTENYPLLSRIRNMLTGGMSTFTCQVYHVQTNEQKIDWGTSSPIEVRDFFLGGKYGLKTSIRGAAAFRVRFNINEDDEACKKTFMRLMGDKSTYTVTDLGTLFDAEIGQKISSVVGKELESMTRQQQSIEGVSSQLEDFAIALKPRFDELFATYGLELVNFSFYNLNVDEDETRKELIDRLVKGVHAASDVGYNMAMQQELLGNITLNPNSGGLAAAGAGMGVGMAAGGAFAQMATTAFGIPQTQQPPQPQGFGGQGRFGTGGAPQQQAAPAQPDPMESLSKMKQLLDAGLIKQEQYDAKVAEIMSRL